MSDLSPKSRALLDAARGAGPSAAGRARMRAGLDARIAAAAVATLHVGSTAASAAGGGAAAASSAAGTAAKFGTLATALKILAGGSLAVALGFGARSVVMSHHAATAAQAPIVASAAPVQAPASTSTNDGAASGPKPQPGSAGLDHDNPAPPSEPAAESSAAAEPADQGPPAPASKHAPRPRAAAPKEEPAPSASASADPVSIAAEVALLRQAQSALKDGDSARSLRALDALSSRHPDGALREERMAARVLALCAAHRVDEARAEATRFLAQMPRSPQADRVRASCAFAKANGK